MDKETYIQKYLHQQLSSKEQAEFELRMESDVEFRNEVEFLTNVIAVNKKAELNHIRGVLDEAESEDESRAVGGGEGMKKYWKPFLIVALLLLLGMTIFFLMRGNSQSDALYASYYKTPLNTYYPILRDGDEGNDKVRKAFQAYEQKNYDKAEELLMSLDNYENDPEIQFYHAISLLEKGKLQQAKAELEKIETEEDFLRYEIQWYRALIALKSGDKEHAKDLLEAGDIKQKPQKWQNILKEL